MVTNILQNCYRDLGKSGNETLGWVGEIKNGKSWKNPNSARDASPRAGEKKGGKIRPVLLFIKRMKSILNIICIFIWRNLF